MTRDVLHRHITRLVVARLAAMLQALSGCHLLLHPILHSRCLMHRWSVKLNGVILLFIFTCCLSVLSLLAMSWITWLYESELKLVMCSTSMVLLCCSCRFVYRTSYSAALWVAQPKLLATFHLICLHVMIDSELGDLNMGTVGSQYFRPVSLHSLFNYSCRHQRKAWCYFDAAPAAVVAAAIQQKHGNVITSEAKVDRYGTWNWYIAIDLEKFSIATYIFFSSHNVTGVQYIILTNKAVSSASCQCSLPLHNLKLAFVCSSSYCVYSYHS